MPRPLIGFGVFVLLLLVVATALLADWWFALPEQQTFEYVGREKCAECHEEQMDLWTGSDHDRAMDHATAATVLGNFDDQEFRHVAFDQIGRLSDDDLRMLLKNVEAEQLALAMHLDNALRHNDALREANETLVARILATLPEETAERVRHQQERLQVVRPCDTAEAQRQIGDLARRLEREGTIDIEFGVRSTFFRRGDEFLVTTDGPDGQMETFQVKYVFGVRPLQQYLVEFPDGRVQCLPVSWDTERKQWFHLYPGEPIPHDDPLHWTRRFQNWNYMCAECHTTNLQKNYDLATDTYHTTWSEIDVSCETCHGPGSLHVELAESNGLFWDRRHGYGLPELGGDDSHVQIETCAPCHSRRRIVFPHPQAGKPFLDYYIPEVLDGNLYYADGQILDEDYVYGSFIQSRMYREGVRCADCHDPHSVRVKFTDNRLCNQCHVEAQYDTRQHHHHPDASKPGTLCVECHMPETTYMVVDPRRDHGIRVPRPDLTVSLKIPNACNGCHNDESKGETPQWAVDKCLEWYGEPDGPTHFAHALAAGREGRPEAIPELVQITHRKDTSASVRASAIALLGRYGNDRALAAGLAGLEDPDELVRVTSIYGLQFQPPAAFARYLMPLLHDPVRAVRVEAARTLSAMPRNQFTVRDREALDAALAEYIEGQQALDDQPGAHLSMAVVHANLGDPAKALAAYETALRIDPEFIPAMNNLAMFHGEQGNRAESERLFRRIIELDPEFVGVHYSLGLLLAEDDAQLDEAVGFLVDAARFTPENPRIRYNLGLAFQKLGRVEEAEAEFKAGLKIAGMRPVVIDILHAMGILYAQTDQWNKAIACAQELIRRDPTNPQWPQFLAYLQRESQRANPSD